MCNNALSEKKKEIPDSEMKTCLNSFYKQMKDYITHQAT